MSEIEMFINSIKKTNIQYHDFRSIKNHAITKECNYNECVIDCDCHHEDCYNPSECEIDLGTDISYHR